MALSWPCSYWHCLQTTRNRHDSTIFSSATIESILWFAVCRFLRGLVRLDVLQGGALCSNVGCLWKKFFHNRHVPFLNYFPVFVTTKIEATKMISGYFIKGDVHWNDKAHGLSFDVVKITLKDQNVFNTKASPVWVTACRFFLDKIFSHLIYDGFRSKAAGFVTQNGHWCRR